LCLECRPLTLFVHLLIICRYANIRKRPLSPQTPKKSKRGRYLIMKDINCKTTGELTPRKKKKFFLTIKQKIQICKLKNSLIKSKNVIKSLSQLSGTSLFQDLEKNLNPVGVNFIVSIEKYILGHLLTRVLHWRFTREVLGVIDFYPKY
jgi:predicted ATP-grasp superfamily ATP-dependent carboligase